MPSGLRANYNHGTLHILYLSRVKATHQVIEIALAVLPPSLLVGSLHRGEAPTTTANVIGTYI